MRPPRSNGSTKSPCRFSAETRSPSLRRQKSVLPRSVWAFLPFLSTALWTGAPYSDHPCQIQSHHRHRQRRNPVEDQSQRLNETRQKQLTSDSVRHNLHRSNTTKKTTERKNGGKTPTGRPTTVSLRKTKLESRPEPRMDRTMADLRQQRLAEACSRLLRPPGLASAPRRNHACL